MKLNINRLWNLNPTDPSLSSNSLPTIESHSKISKSVFGVNNGVSNGVKSGESESSVTFRGKMK